MMENRFKEHLIFQNQAIRDLAWVIGSPGLINHPKFGTNDWYAHLVKNHKAWLSRLDKEPASLLKHLNTFSHLPLGKYVEQLISFWLTHSPFYEVIATNHQVFREKITIGEFDVLVRDLSSGEVWHWEIAVKYYLGIQNSPKWENWIGPNAKDSLARKLTKMFDHQLTLSDTNDGRETLNRLGISSIKTLGFVKGLFFADQSPNAANLVIPNSAEIDRFYGSWGKIYNIPKSGFWKILGKGAWLGCQLAAQSELHTAQEVTDLVKTSLEENGKSVCIARFEQEEDYWEEKERYFIVPENWPQATAAISSGSTSSN